MNFLASSLRWLLCAALALPFTASTAADLDPEMRAALRQLAAAEKLDKTLPPLLANARAVGIEQVRLDTLASIDAATAWPEEQRARARKLMEELAPRHAAALDADLHRFDLEAMALAMLEAVYPKYFTVQEVRQLGAHFGSPAYWKMTEVTRMVREEHARTGQDKEQLWRLYSTSRISLDEDRQIAAFLASPLGKKHAAIRNRLGEEVTAELRRQITPTFAAAATAHRKLFLEKLAQAR